MDAQPPLPPVAQEMIVAQAAALAQLRAEVAQLKATVEELARRLGRTSRNFSPPPSADPPQAVSKRPRHEPSGRQPGGQPGHEGQTRALLPVEAVNVVMPLKPVQYLHCQHPLGGEDPQPQRHQVTDIPPIKPVVTEYQLHQLVCPACGAAIWAEVPGGVPAGEFGPRVQKFELHYTPGKGSWLTMAEIELSVLARQGLARRMGNIETCNHAVIGWTNKRNHARKIVRWHFTQTDARRKLKSTYPMVQD
jgi:hypothetical protein